MIRVTIVEDEKKQRDLLCSYLQRFSCEQKIPLEIKLFSDGQELVDCYQNDADILLLDIHMRQMDGMNASQIIREQDENVVIIFITNMVQYAIQGYSVQAMDFILKPVQYESFRGRLLRAMDKIEKKRQSLISLKTINHGYVRLEYSSIYYCEMLNRKLSIHTNNGVYQCNRTLNKLQQEMPAKHFYRCHSAFLINLLYVERIDKGAASVAGKEIPVSRKQRNGLLDALTNYMGDRL